MTMRGHSFLPLLICVTFPSFIIVMGDRVVSAAAQYKDGKSSTQEELATLSDDRSLDQSFRIAEALVDRLGSGNLRNTDEAKRVAAKALSTTLPDLLAGDVTHAQQLGFGSNATGQDIELLPNVFPIYEVDLNQLRSFSTSTNVKHLLSYTNQLLIPIGSNKQVQSSVTVRFIPNELGGMEQQATKESWRPTRWGRPNLIRRLTMEQTKRKTQGFLVSIPALNRNFLGYEDNTGIQLIPLADDYLLEAGKSYLAHLVFKQLAQEAESMDGSPR